MLYGKACPPAYKHSTLLKLLSQHKISRLGISSLRIGNQPNFITLFSFLATILNYNLFSLLIRSRVQGLLVLGMKTLTMIFVQAEATPVLPHYLNLAVYFLLLFYAVERFKFKKTSIDCSQDKQNDLFTVFRWRVCNKGVDIFPILSISSSSPEEGSISSFSF